MFIQDITQRSGNSNNHDKAC